MTTLYISGPISHYPNENRNAFDIAEIRLKAAGYDVLNPFSSPLNDPDYPDKASLTFPIYLREDLGMVLKSDAIAILPGAEWSRGSRLEVDVAMGLEMPVLTVELWLKKAGYWLDESCEETERFILQTYSPELFV